MTSRSWLILGGLVATAAATGFAGLPPAQSQRGRDAALLEASRAGNLAAVREALAAGANPNCRDESGITPLMLASRGNRPDSKNPAPTDHPDVVEALISKGADVNARTSTGFVALFWAARYGHEGAARALIRHGADVRAKDRDGMTALRWAQTNQQTKVIALLKEAGATE